VAGPVAVITFHVLTASSRNFVLQLCLQECGTGTSHDSACNVTCSINFLWRAIYMVYR